jgi:DNA-binding LacI/PurR family transcriptional regulator
MKAILESGIGIPSAIKVIGAGNVHYSDLLRVPPSTADHSGHAIARKAADILSKAVTSKRMKPPPAVLIEPVLMAREPTGG